jgi:hypothetical protein
VVPRPPLARIRRRHPRWVFFWAGGGSVDPRFGPARRAPPNFESGWGAAGKVVFSVSDHTRDHWDRSSSLFSPSTRQRPLILNVPKKKLKSTHN